MPGHRGCAAPSMGCGRSARAWARPGSGFTMLFEALALTFAKAMPVAKVAEMTREHDTRIWRVLEHHVHAARDQQDFSGVRKVGMDETSARKGQDYVSIFADLEAGRVLFATEGRSADTVARFAVDLTAHGGDPKRITDTSSDMSTAFIAGIGEHLPNATLTFDRYHLAAKLSEAVNQVRRTEVRTRPELKRTRWLWLKNHSNLSTKQQGELHQLMRPSAKLAKTIKKFQQLILNAVEYGLSNARSEATNTHLRLLTRRSYGLSPESLMAMAELTRGGLCPPLPGRTAA